MDTAKACGLREITGTEAAAIDLPGASEMFQNTWARLKGPVMTDAERELSFLNRWVFLTKAA